MATEYNSEGRLPIHEAAFRNYETVIDRIVANLIAKDGNRTNDEDDNNNDQNGEDIRRTRLAHRARVQEMLEAVTYDYFRLTPLLAATVGNARRAIECLIHHGAKVSCRDGDNRSMAGIAILKQNVDLFLYFSEASYANELDLWNTLITMFTSKAIDESVAAGRVLEQLTAMRYLQTVWPNLVHLRLAEKAIQMFAHAVNNNPNEELITSSLLIIYNLLSVDSQVRALFQQNEEGLRALVKMRKINETLSLLFAHIICYLCDDPTCIQLLVNQNLIGELQILLNTDTDRIPVKQACLYFDILSKIARCHLDYQTLIQNSSTAKTSILEQAIDLLERYDRQLTISVLHFIRDLCSQNEQQQQICAVNRYLIAHLLSALNSTYRDVQRSSVDTLQMIVTQNTISQLTILRQGGAEQLLTLLNKATLPRLRISIICTLWSLTGDEADRRQAMANAIKVSTLVEFLNLKSTDQLYIILDAVSELLRRVPTADENILIKFGRRHCIPPLVRIISQDHEEKLLLKCLDCIQQLCLLPTFSPCRSNQTIFPKANGLNQILILIRRSNQNKMIQAKAITTLAYAIFDHKENKELLSKNVIQQVFKRLASLLFSLDEDIQIEAGAALAALICTDITYYNLCSEMISLDHEHFRHLLASKKVSVRCNAAFQMIICIRLISDTDVTQWIGQGLMVLFEAIADPRIDDEAKLLPTDIIGRLAHIPTGFGIHKHSGVREAIITSDGLERVIALLGSSNVLLQGNAAVTIDCLVRDSPEGQRRLLKQCRSHTPYLDILRTYVLGPSTLRSRIDDLYQSVHREQVHFPPIRKAEHPRRVPTI